MWRGNASNKFTLNGRPLSPGTFAYFTLWPLALTAGIGTRQQLKMPERIFEHVAKFLGPGVH